MTARTRLVRLALAVAVSTALAACSAGGSSPSAGSIRVEDAWARPSMGMERAAAAYLVLLNGTGQADALVSADSPAAATVELHETTAGASGMMAMHPVERIALPADGRVALEPGGLHVMLIDLVAELSVGDTIELTLTFEHAAPVTVRATVREG